MNSKSPTRLNQALGISNPVTASTYRIITINLILNTNSYLKEQYKHSANKWIITFSSLLFVKILFRFKDPRSKLLTSNIVIPKKFIDNNYVIDIALKSTKHHHNQFLDFKENNNFKVKHIPYFDSIYKIFNKLTKSNTTISQTKEVKTEDLLDIKLAGISKISTEGRYQIEKLIRTNPKFYFKFNHLRYHDTVEAYGWVFFKTKTGRIFNKKHNLNLYLVKNGYAEFEPLKTNVYDERIYYYYSDLIDADKWARAKGIGVWQEYRKWNVSDITLKPGFYHILLNKITKRLILNNMIS